MPDFLTDFFCGLLGYTRPADGGSRYTISREKHVEVDGKFADAVLGSFGHQPHPHAGTRADPHRYRVALEGKGPRHPLERPFAGRRMSAVDQAYRYASNPRANDRIASGGSIENNAGTKTPVEPLADKGADHVTQTSA